MNITLDGYEITKAIKTYLESKNIDWSDDYLQMYISDKNKKMINLHRYNQDEHWDSDKREWITDAEYEVDGLYVRRKKKGQEKYQYVPLDKSCIATEIRITENNTSELEIWEDLG